jgi:hypothetical protein
MNEDFQKVANIYLSKGAKPLDIEEYTHRGCKCWVFRRVIRRWRPTSSGLWRYHKGEYKYKDMPENEREYYKDEFWMGISEYFTKYGCEFEETVEKTISESMIKEEAKYRLNHFIDEDYAELVSTEIIP